MLLQMTPEEESIELKYQLFTTIAHEFRTPLSAIVLCTELLENYDHLCTEEKKREYLCMIREAALEMNQLLTETLQRYGAD